MGSLIILDFENIGDVNNFIKNDPYSEIKLFSDIKIKKFNRVLQYLMIFQLNLIYKIFGRKFELYKKLFKGYFIINK